VNRDYYTNYPRTILWLIRGGETLIGGDEPDAQPRFSLEIAPFYISKKPITNRQYEAFDSGYTRSSRSPGDDDPAVGVTYSDAVEYCEWYASVARKAFRLPSEIEWEHAARAGETGRLFCDPEEADARIWHAGNSGGRVPDLEAKGANDFGLYAMLGGVWEWTSSRYRPYPSGESGQGDDPRFVLRGGAYTTPLARISCSVREPEMPATRREDVGFRIVRAMR